MDLLAQRMNCIYLPDINNRKITVYGKTLCHDITAPVYV